MSKTNSLGAIIYYPAVFLHLLLGVWLFSCSKQKTLPKNLAHALKEAPDTFDAQKRPPLRMAFDRFSVEDGLCSNFISCIFQDSRGFLWVGTDDGLNRYDGYQFKQYRHEESNPQSLLQSNTLQVVEDRQGHIWVLCTSGLSEIDPETNTIETYLDTLCQGRINTNPASMVIDKDDIIWIDGNNLAFDISRKQFFLLKIPFEEGGRFTVNSSGKVSGVSTELLKDSLGGQLMRSAIFSYDCKTEKLNFLFDTVAASWTLGSNKLLTDRDDVIWFGRQDGELLHFDSRKKTIGKARPCRGSIKGMHYTFGNNVLWLAGWCGLSRYALGLQDENAHQLYVTDERDPTSLPTKITRCVLEDNAGNVWVGTQDAGLCRYSPSKHKFESFSRIFPDTANLAGKTVEALHFDKNDQLWVGTNKGLNLLLDRKQHIFKTFRQPTYPGVQGNYNWIKAIAEDTVANRLYLAYWGMPLDYFDMERQRFELLHFSNFSEKEKQELGWSNFFISSLQQYHGGNIYYANWGGFLQRYNLDSGEFTTFCLGNQENYEHAKQKGFLSPLTLVLWIDEQGILWLGNSDEKGVQKLDLSQGDALGTTCYSCMDNNHCGVPKIGAFTNFLPDRADSTKLQHGQATCFLEDSKKRLWIGSGSGLHLALDREKGVFRKFGSREGFPNELINSILEDDHDNLWVATNKGICRFDPEKGRVTATYNSGDGLQGNQFSLNAASKSKTGLMAFGGPNGFNLFHPDSLWGNPHVPFLAVSEFYINGAEAGLPGEGIKLSHDQKNLAFEVTALDLSNPSENQFQYFLEGFEKDWCAPTTNRRAVYTNLAPGNYSFHLKGSNNDGVWNDTGLVFPIIINAPWWATWWFRLLLIAAAAGLIWYFFRQRDARLRKSQEDSERLIKYLQVQTLQAQINPHFIFNVLGAMQNRILNADAMEANRHLVNLSKLIRRFLDSSVSSAPPGRGMEQNDIPLEQEIELLQLYVEFEMLQKPGKFDYEIIVGEGVNPSSTAIPPMIVQPFVENAIKHGLLYLESGEIGHLEISFSKIADGLVVRIQDDGVGRERAAEIQQRSHKIYKSHGSRLVQERAAILNELGYDISIHTEDRLNGGTTVSIKIKE